MDKERRAHKRYLIGGLRARLCETTMFGLSTKPTAQEYPCLDISEGGLQLAVKLEFKKQDKVILDLSIPNSRTKPLRVKAQLVWFKDAGLAGVKFISLDETQQAEIKMLIGKFGSDKDQTSPYIRSKMLKGDSLYGRFQK